MEGDAGNALPGSETGITVAGNDQAAPTVPEIPENIQENNENGNQDTLKDGRMFDYTRKPINKSRLTKAILNFCARLYRRGNRGCCQRCHHCSAA